MFRSQVQSIELTERTSAEFLKGFFASYLEFLRRAGQFELANHLDSRLGKLLGHIARDESRPGVIQALFYDKTGSVGHSGFIHVLITTGPDEEELEPIQYAAASNEIIDLAMKQASVYAREAVDFYLKRAGLPDGLEERLIRWEIATVEGEPVKLHQHFQGGSIALPLAVAVISQYLARPVANDIAFTGAFTEATVKEGHIQPVDGIPEKIRHAVTSGSRLVYIPATNVPLLDNEPSLKNIVSEYNAQVVPAESIDQVCSELFPPEGSGRIFDLIKEVAINVLEILGPRVAKLEETLEKPTHLRYRNHIILCSLFTAFLVFLEGWRAYKVFVPDFPVLAAWCRIVLSSALIFTGMVVSFGIPAACLKHRKIWAWYAGTCLLAVVLTGIAVLIGNILPDFGDIGSFWDFPPVAGLVKDLFVMWIFAWAIALNTFNAVAAFEDLITHRQFVTARSCLQWDSPLERRMPIRCIHFPWHWGVIFIAVTAGWLIILELNYYATLDQATAAGYWETFLGLGRDLVFIFAIGEVMIFYRIAISRIRRALS
jgi:hypothetical protein